MSPKLKPLKPVLFARKLHLKEESCSILWASHCDGLNAGFASLIRNFETGTSKLPSNLKTPISLSAQSNCHDLILQRRLRRLHLSHVFAIRPTHKDLPNGVTANQRPQFPVGFKRLPLTAHDGAEELLHSLGSFARRQVQDS